MRFKRINEVLPMTDGLFYRLFTKHNDLPISADNGKILDIDYLYNSGEKISSPLLANVFGFEQLITKDYESFLTKHLQNFLVQNDYDDSMNKLCDIIYLHYGKKWKKLFSDYDIEYNPLNNYNITETEIPDDFEIKDVRTEKNKQTTETYGNTESGGYGFNSTTSQPIADTNANSTITSYGNATDNEIVNTHTESGQRTKTRTGNSGDVADIIEKEFNLWEHIDLIKMIYNDVDKLITLKIY